MRITELERALIERLQLIEESDALANSIAERACTSCEKALQHLEAKHAEEINHMTDEVIGVKLERDLLYEVIQGLEELPDWDGRGAALPGYQIFLRIQQEELALKAVQDELAENVNREAAQDEMLRFTPEDRIVLTVEGVKIAVGGGENAREVGRL